MDASEQRDRQDETEGALLRRVAAGDRAAFETLYREYYRRLGRFLDRLTQRPDLIDEVINDAFWVVWRKAAGFRGGSRVSTWIMGIAYRCALKALRRGGTMGEHVALHENHASEEPRLAYERQEWLRRGLHHLPDEQRTTLELAYFHGHSCQEIGEIMGCPASTVKARMFHARVKLRNLLPQLGGDGDRHESAG